MPISFVGAQNFITFDGSSFNVSKPTGTAEGDVMIAVVHAQYYFYADLTTPAGWTFLDGRDNSPSYGGHSKVVYKVAGPSEPASYAFSASGNGAHCSASVITLRDVPLTGGVPSFVVAKSTNSNDDAPTVTPTGSADMLVCIVLADHDGGSGRTYTAPAGMTERIDSGWGYLSHTIATQLLASSAATGTRDFVATGNTPNAGSQAQYSIAVSSGGGGGPSPVAGTLSASVPRVTSSIAGTRTAPTASGNVSASVPRVQSTIAGTVTPPTYSGTVSASLPKVTGGMSGTVTPPTYSGTISTAIPPTRSTITGTTTAPAGAASLSATLPPVIGSLAGTVTAPTWAGTLDADLAPVTGTISGTVAGPLFAGSIDGTLPKVTGTIAGTATVPTVSGSLVATLPRPTASLVGVVEVDDDLVPASARILAAKVRAPNASGTVRTNGASGTLRTPTTQGRLR